LDVYGKMPAIDDNITYNGTHHLTVNRSCIFCRNGILVHRPFSTGSLWLAVLNWNKGK